MCTNVYMYLCLSFIYIDIYMYALKLNNFMRSHLGQSFYKCQLIHSKGKYLCPTTKHNYFVVVVVFCFLILFYF